MNQINAIGIDLAKNVFELCGEDAVGNVVLRKRVRRAQLIKTLANLEPCLVGMEACGGANFWAREIRKLGHQVKLLPAQYVKGYAQGNKTDRNDALAICEAVQRPRVPEVAVKTENQQAIQTYLRTRQLLIGQRTAISNAIRGHLLEFGIVHRKGAAALTELVENALSNESLPGMLLETLQILWSEYLQLKDTLAHMDRRIAQLAREDEVATRLQALPGVGPLSALAVITFVGDAQVFRNGRQMCAWLGIVPRQHSSGDKVVLQGISKRGNTYLRTLLIHGARAAMLTKRDDPQLRWARTVAARRGENKAVVALANKNVRVLWKLMATGESYRYAA